MSHPGEPCVRCGHPLTDGGETIRCQKCGFEAYKGGAIINMGGRDPNPTLVCPHCGGMASASLFKEFVPKTKEKMDVVEEKFAEIAKEHNIERRRPPQ